MTHVAKVKEGIAILNGTMNDLNDEKNRVQKMVEMIPTHKNTRDELGENVAEALEDISNNIDKNIIDNITNVLERAHDFKLKAAEKDRLEKLAKEKENNTVTEASETLSVTPSRLSTGPVRMLQ